MTMQGNEGVIDVALLSVIRRWHLRDGIPIREIGLALVVVELKTDHEYKLFLFYSVGKIEDRC
jgi:hypothetical protein